MVVYLKKDKDNEYDKEAISVNLAGLGKIDYVANSPYTVLGESYNAGRLSLPMCSSGTLDSIVLRKKSVYSIEILIKTILLSLNCHITTPKIKKWSTQKRIDRFFRSHLVLVGYTAFFAPTWFW
jgi:hypothetical protein